MTRERSEIAQKHRWAIDEIYDEEPEKEIEEIKQLADELKDYRGELDREERLARFLDKYSDCMRRLSTLARYASMKSDEDTSDQEAQALKSRVNALKSDVSEEMSFVKLEIQSIEDGELEEMIEENPEIGKRDHWLKEFKRLEPHTRSEEVEKTLSSLSEVLDAPSETYSLLSNADMEFQDVERDGEKQELSQSNFTKLLKDPNQSFRREVYETFFETFSQYENTIGAMFSKNIIGNIKHAEIRDYSSAREAALKPSNIPLEVYNNLVETVKERNEVLHEHLELKAEARGIEDPGMEDVYLPIPESESPEIGYEEAKEHIVEALRPLGEDYVEKVKEAFEDRWVDVYETENKRSGAYSGGSYDTRPFILMNYQDDINSMYTLIHELGHSMHSQLTSENQPFLHSDYDIFVAEVASTVNEALLTRHLLEEVEDENFRRHVLSHSLENFRSTLFRQTMFADFEQQVHKRVEDGKPVTPGAASEIYGELKKKFYKPYEVDEMISREWMRIPHFYYNFYVYQYATGISAAKTLSQQIVEDGPGDYLEFLKSGGSDAPIELLKKAGIDMTSKRPIEKAIDLYSERIDEMRESLD